MSNADANKANQLDEGLQLDQLALRCLEILEEILSERSSLETLLKESFMSMAKARYNMGNKSVSTMQLPTEDSEIRAQHVVMSDWTTNESCVKFKQFSISSSFVKDGQERMKENDIRLRTNKKGESDADVVSKLGDLKLEKEKTNIQSQRDPLRWFGILVPVHLKDCQAGFRKSLPILCNIASLHNELEATSQLFREKKFRK